MNNRFISASNAHVLNAARLDQMIATALSMPQEQRKTGLSLTFYHFIMGIFIPKNTLRSGFAVMATILIISIVTLNQPVSITPLDSEMDNTLSELHDILLYDTIDTAI